MVCDRWSEFAAFLADMGERPAGMTLDRINNELGYEPANCRWATMAEQSQNRRTTKPTAAQVVDIRSRLQAGERSSALAREFGVTKTCIKDARSRAWRNIG